MNDIFTKSVSIVIFQNFVLISGGICSCGQSVVTQFMNVVIRVTKQCVRKARLKQIHRQEWRGVDDQIQKDVNAFTIFHVFFGSFLCQPKRKKLEMFLQIKVKKIFSKRLIWG